MILVSILLLGGVAVTRLPLGFLPNMDDPELHIRVPYPNASPEQVKNMIARPVEDALGSLAGIKYMKTRCGDDGLWMNLEFEWSVDLRVAQVEVWEKLDRIRRDLPEDIGDITVSEDWDNSEADDPIIEARVSSNRDLSEDYDLLERKLIKPIQRLPGVAQIRLDGIQPKEIQINLRLSDLDLHGMDIRDVFQSLRGGNFDLSLGRLSDGGTRYTVRMLASFREIEQIGELVLRPDGLRLRNIADINYQQPALVFGRHLDGKFAIGLTVSAESKANVVTVCDLVEAKIRELDSDPEMTGIRFLEWFNQGKEIRATLKELFRSGVFGALLASVVLFAFLRRPSTTLVSVLCIPFSLIVTCGIIWLQGRSLNTLTLLGLIVGIGMLVDNAVVVIESIFRYQEMGYDQKDSARYGARDVSMAVIAATLTSVIVFLPIIFNDPSRMNIRFREIGLTVCMTLLASLFISQTLIPLATSWLIKARQRPPQRWMGWLEDRYERILSFNLRHRWVAPLSGIAILASMVHPFNHVDWNFDSGRKRMYATVEYRFSEETTLEKKEAQVTRVEKLIDPHREEFHTKAVYSWWSDRHTMTRVYPKEGYRNEEHLAFVRESLRELLPEVAGVRIEVPEAQLSWRRNSGKRVAVQLRGEDPEILAELAEELRRRMNVIEGLRDAYTTDRVGRKELHVVLNPDLVPRRDLAVEQVANTISLTFRGRRLQRFRTPEGEREMRLTLDEKETESLSQLRDLPVFTPDGTALPLASVARFVEQNGPSRIERDDRMTSVWVGAKYKTGTRNDYIPKVSAVLDSINFPHGYSWSFGSWQKEHEARSQEFLTNLALALLLVFAVMAGLFESVSRALALMIALPFALSGALWTLYLSGTDFDQPAAVGLLLLIGIVVNNGIVMIEHINSYQRQGMPRMEAMLRGGRERLRPILMTAATTLLGLLPIVIQRPSLGGIFYFSMALVVMGGLAVSTVLTALFLPTTATLVEDFFTGCARLVSLLTRPFRGSKPATPQDSVEPGQV